MTKKVLASRYGILSNVKVKILVAWLVTQTALTRFYAGISYLGI